MGWERRRSGDGVGERIDWQREWKWEREEIEEEEDKEGGVGEGLSSPLKLSTRVER